MFILFSELHAFEEKMQVIRELPMNNSMGQINGI